MTQTPFGAFFFFLPSASSAEDIKKRAFYSTLFLYLIILFLCEHLCNFFVEVVFSLCDTFALFVTLKSNN